MKQFITAVLIGLASPGFAQVTTSNNATVTVKTEHEFKYTNPITQDSTLSMRDHFILKVGNKWYCTGTSNPVWSGPNPGVRLLVSDDLLHWKHLTWIIDSSKLPKDCPYNGRFWAPEIHFIKNKFYLTINSGIVTAEDPKGETKPSIWLFSSDTITGPYKLVNGPLTEPFKNDATLFEDEDGQTYVYASGGGLHQAKIDLKTGKLATPMQKFLDKKQPGWPDWIMGGIEGPFVIKKDGTYFMFFSTWTRGYEVGLLKSKTPLGPWELASPEPIFGTRKREHRLKNAISGGYTGLQYQDTEDPYEETGHNALFIGPDGELWSSCHYLTDEKRRYPYSQTFEPWEHTAQLGIEPVYFKNGRFYINGPTWTEQTVRY
jgi:xylan 1,4-beta-xylosidase